MKAHSAACRLAAMLAVLAGCAVGPNYQPAIAPAACSRCLQDAGAVARRRSEGQLPKGAWWEVFNDAELNDYEQQLLKANQSLLAAKDRLEEARSLARVTSAAVLPTGVGRSQCFAQPLFADIVLKCSRLAIR